MSGLSQTSGKFIDRAEHIRQSIRDILTTPIGSRVMNREYGSRLFNLIDTPLNASTVIEFYAATIEALERWEKRIKVIKVSSVLEARRVLLTIHYSVKGLGDVQPLEVRL